MMTEDDFPYATDNDPKFEYRHILGGGGHGSVHEVNHTLPIDYGILMFT
jgi:hypothetical protein